MPSSPDLRTWRGALESAYRRVHLRLACRLVFKWWRHQGRTACYALWQASTKPSNHGPIDFHDCNTLLGATALERPLLLWIDHLRFENLDVIFFKYLVQPTFPTGSFARLIERLSIIAVLSFHDLDTIAWRE